MSALDPATIDLDSLPSVSLLNRNELPDCAAVYFVLSWDNTLLYIGRTGSLWQRWVNHHVGDTLRLNDGVRIAWLEVSDAAILPSIEKALIAQLQPLMNGETVARFGESEYGTGRKRLNLYIPRDGEELIQQARHAAIDEGVTLSELFFRALTEYLTAHDKKK